MNTSQSRKTATANRQRGLTWIVVVSAVAVGGLLAAAWLVWGGGGSSSAAAGDQPLFQARRGPLAITVPVSGTIRSEQARVLESQVEGNVAIVSLVDEGTRVEKGDLLVQLDTSELEDEKRQAELELQNAQAAYVNAKQTLEITKRQGDADITAARVGLEQARRNLQKYLGTAPKKLALDQLDMNAYFAASAEEVDVLTDSPVLRKIKQLNSIPLTPADQRIERKLASLDGDYSAAGEAVIERIQSAIADEPAGPSLQSSDASPPQSPRANGGGSSAQSSNYRQQVKQIINQADGAYSSEVSQTLDQIERTVTRANYDQRIQQILDSLEGEYKQNVQTALNKIRIAESELTRARDQLAGSHRLAEKGYITERELEADQLEKQRRESELQQARGELKLLRRFTFQSKLTELQNAVEQKSFELDKAEHAKESNIIDAEADLASKKEQLAGEKSHLKEIKEQIEYASIEAPTDGVVVYAERDDDEAPLDTGVQVREREDLIRLPTADSMVADVDIHESMVRKVETGLPAEITTGALSDQTFNGEVSHVAIMPDRGHRWLNPDRRVYNARIAIDAGQSGLRPGMSCKAEIIVKRFEDVTYVPLQAVVRVNGQTRVYVPGPDGPEPREVSVGMDNNKMVRITDGLKEGESVLLTPPIPSAGSDLASARQGKGKKPGADKDQDETRQRGSQSGERKRRGGGQRGGGSSQRG
jgi:RND family efflux transporter MFP subunit